MTNSAKIYAGLKPNVPMVSYQGAEILNHSDYSILNSVELDKKYISEVLDVVKFFPVNAMIQYSNQIYCDTDDSWIQDYAFRNNVDLISDKNYIKAQQRDPLRMVMIGEPEIIINLEVALKEAAPGSVFKHRNMYVLVTEEGIDTDNNAFQIMAKYKIWQGKQNPSGS